jgi:large subunit ribosomal protein L23
VNARDVILRPLVTEQSMAGIAEGRYTFAVDPRANKVEIRRAVEEIWGVSVDKVNTMNVRGKQRRMGRSAGYRPDWKKAIVKLRSGQRIEFFEGLV